MFLPITATPFSHPGYKEILPDKALAPHVRCYWISWNEEETPNPASPELEKIHSVVIPDLCADIIIVINGTENPEDSREITSMGFCGVNDKNVQFRAFAEPLQKTFWNPTLFLAGSTFFRMSPFQKPQTDFSIYRYIFRLLKNFFDKSCHPL